MPTRKVGIISYKKLEKIFSKKLRNFLKKFAKLQWDAQYVDFWKNVPLKWRYGKKLYIECVSRLYSRIAGIPAYVAKKRNDSPYVWEMLFMWLKDIVRSTPLKAVLKPMFLRLVNNKQGIPLNENLENDWEQSCGRMNENIYKELMPYMTCRSSCTTLEKLKYISYNDVSVPDEVIMFLKKMRDR